jgi:hypothetical protein
VGLKDIGDKLKRAGGKAAKSAAKGVAKTALGITAGAARGALDAMGDAIEEAMFGEKKKAEPDEAPETPDPFATIKAKERAKKDEKKR